MPFFADDVLLFMSDPCGDLSEVFKVISFFGSFSGYKINITKSEALHIGVPSGRLDGLGRKRSCQDSHRSHHILRHQKWEIHGNPIFMKLYTAHRQNMLGSPKVVTSPFITAR